MSAMQSNQDSIADNGDKSLAEWPTLSDVCSNVKPNSATTRSTRNEQKQRSESPAEKGAEGYDSAKENEELTHHVNGRGARKKGSRQKWVPVPIAPPPYRKRFERGSSRPSYEVSRGASNGYIERKNESHEFMNGNEYARGYVRGNGRVRGKRGGGGGRVISQNWRQRREETSRGEIENCVEGKELPSDADYFQSMVYYDPYSYRFIELKKGIKNQIEYYFSEENLVKDFFIRKNMDSQGFVPLKLVAGFRRVEALQADFSLIVEAVEESDKLEVLDRAKVRPVIDPLKWPLCDYDHRVGVLRPDVPDFIPGQPYPAFTAGTNSLMTVLENFSRLRLYSNIDHNAEQHMPNGVMDPTDNNFDSLTQNTPVEATS